MEKIIFFSLVIPILGFVLYLGGTAIMKGFDAKKGNREKSIEEQNDLEDNFYRIGKITEDKSINFISEKGYDVEINGYKHFK